MTQYQVRAQRRARLCRNKRRVRRFARVILAAAVLLLLVGIGFWRTAFVCAAGSAAIWAFYRLAIFKVERRNKAK